MKKLILGVIAILLLSLSACGGLHDASKISITDPMSKEFITVKINAKKANIVGNIINFAISQDLNDYANILEEQQNNIFYSTKIYQNKFILLRTKQSCFLTGEIENCSEDQTNDNRYAICSPIGNFRTATNVVNMYMPYHLLKIETFSDIYNKNSFSSNTATYETVGSIDDIFKFYIGFDRYYVERQNDSITVIDRLAGDTMQITFSQNKVTFTIE